MIPLPQNIPILKAFSIDFVHEQQIILQCNLKEVLLVDPELNRAISDSGTIDIPNFPCCVECKNVSWSQI